MKSLRISSNLKKEHKQAFKIKKNIKAPNLSMKM